MTSRQSFGFTHNITVSCRKLLENILDGIEPFCALIKNENTANSCCKVALVILLPKKIFDQVCTISDRTPDEGFGKNVCHRVNVT